MSKTHCPHETSVLKALEEGVFDRTLRNHMASCDICMNLAMVSRWMGEFEKWSGGGMEEKTLPAPEAVWQGAKSPVPSRRELSRKIMRILNFPKIWAVLVVLVSGYLIAPAFLPRFFESFKSLFGDRMDLTLLGSIIDALQKTLPYVILPLMLVLLFTLGVFFFSVFNPEKV